jgi:hypothetical protein
MKAVSIRIDGMSGALRTAKSGLLDAGLVQAVDTADLAEHRLAELQAVVDRCRLREIEQRTRQDRVLDVDIHAADQIGGVLLLRQIARSRTRGPALGENEDRRPVGVRPDKGVGMDRNEEVGLDSPRFLHPCMQGNEESPNRASGRRACSARPRSWRAALGHRQRDVFLVAATAPDGSRILAAVPRIEGDGHQAIDHWLALAFADRLLLGDLFGTRVSALIFASTAASGTVRPRARLSTAAGRGSLLSSSESSGSGGFRG